MKTLQHRADSFVDYAEHVSLGSWESFFKNKPHVRDAIAENGYRELTFEQKSGKWDFLMIVAMAWWVNNLAHIQLSKSEFETVARILACRVADWNPGGVPAFSDLNSFVCGYARQYENIDLSVYRKLLVRTKLTWRTPNTRLERTRHERASLLRCVGEPLKRSVGLLRYPMSWYDSIEVNI